MSIALFLLLLPPLQNFAQARSNYDYQINPKVALEQSVILESAVPVEVPIFADLKPSKWPQKRSIVSIAGRNYRYVYRVNGRLQWIRGMGYNVRYRHLDREERARRYDRDFSLMKEAGINTILGWERKQFDELTLDKAQEHGIGVVLPYDLAPKGKYDDPMYQEFLARDITEWVRRYKDHPALRMWGLGNEVFHQISGAQAEAFARFYVALADLVHMLDPYHPVIYRGAEDVYVGPLRQRLQKDGRHRPWFLYGINIFTPRISEVLKNWPRLGLDMPIIVSEFAMFGVTAKDRPVGYRRMWREIRRDPLMVLGGFAYVWSTNGPEALDRHYGLVDENGNPADSSLETLDQEFENESQAQQILEGITSLPDIWDLTGSTGVTTSRH